MSYKHANAVRVRSKAKGMHYLIFCELAALMHADGKLIDDQVKLVNMLRVNRSTLKRSIRNLLNLGELEIIPTKRRGIATEYRSRLGEIESAEMYEHFRGLVDLVRGAESTPNDSLRGAERTPNSDTENIRGAESAVRGAESAVRGAESTTSGCTEHPPKTLELLKQKELQKPFLENNSKAKGKTMKEWQKNFKTNPLLKDEIAERMASQHEYKPALLATECMTFTREAIASGKHSEDWVQEYRDWLRPKLQAYSKGSHYG